MTASQSRKIISARPGESRRSIHALASGASGNEQTGDDSEYIDSMVAKSKRLKQQPQKSSYISQKFFYGAAPPMAPDFAELKEQLKIIDSPTLAELEGSIEGVRDKMRKYAQCSYCWLAYRDRQAFLAHLVEHQEVRSWLEFQETAMADYESLQDMQGELTELVAGDEKKLKEMDSRIARLRQLERVKTDALIQDGEVDEDLQNLVTGGLDGEDYTVVKPDAELTKLREKLQNIEGKAEGLKIEMSRKQERLKQVERKISRFERCADTRLIARGQAAGDSEVLALLRESMINYDPSAAGTRKMIHIPSHGLTPFSNMRSSE